MMQNQEITLYAGTDAFGDGAHPTTQLMLAALDAIDTQTFTPSAVCDMGCGAGLLAMRAAQRFGCTVIAVDIERTAIEATRENAAKNGLPVEAIHSDGFNHPTIAAHVPYDLILMNILEEPLTRLAVDAVNNLAEEGIIIMSGMLVWQQEHIMNVYQSLGMELAHRLQMGDWVALAWQKA
ncbi:MAG: 50S ribosomal protein L11 methyltransferase [Rickettsiales bacterium]